MAAKVQRRRPVADWMQKAQMYLFHRHEVRELEKPRDNEKKWLKAWLADNGVEDPETGNLRAEFPVPIKAYGSTAYGMELRKIPGGEYFDKDEVLEYLQEHVGPETRLTVTDIKRVFKTVKVAVFDQDQLYVLQQEGLIPEKELRKLIHENDPTYQLWPVESPFPDDDDD